LSGESALADRQNPSLKTTFTKRGKMIRASRTRALTCLVALAAVAACQAPATAFDANAESAKLMARDAEWSNLATEGKDIDKIVSYWTDDAVVMEPGQPVVEGKAAIRAYVTQSEKTPGFKIHWVSQKPAFSADGTMAYMRATDEMTVPGPKGAPMTLHLQGYSVWRKEADGQWRCSVDIANEAPAAAAPAA
jgi:ketosteroid isomerase-like protein